MAKTKILSTEIEISKVTYEDENNETKEFFTVEMQLGGEKINLVPKTEDKKLFNHLIKQAK